MGHSRVPGHAIPDGGKKLSMFKGLGGGAPLAV